MAPGVALAGRVRELELVTRHLTGASDAAALLVVGEAGIGKSRLVAAAADAVAVEGIVVVSGWCLPMSERMPLLPVLEALHGLEAVEDGALLKAALAACAPFVGAELARLLPGLDDQADASPASAGSAGPGEAWRRQRLFDAIRRLLLQIGLHRRAAAVIEDLHWADPTTVELLDYLLAPSVVTNVPLVVTCRSEHTLTAELTDWLERAQRNPRITRLDLTALTLAETREQIELLLGETPTSSLLEHTYARSEGNAFFTEQLVSATRHGASPDELPSGLTALLLARTAPLAGASRDLVAALAVAGRPLDEPALGTVCGRGTAETGAALRELATARLLRRPDRAGRHQLRHALLAEAVANEMLPSERQRLHGAVGDLLAELCDDTAAAEVADHLRAAGRANDELRWRIAAARRAETLFAFHDAANQWLRALELWTREPSDLTVEGMSLLDVYGAAQDALDAGGRETESLELAEEALARYRASDSASRAEALRRAGWSIWRSGDEERGIELLREAIGLYEQLPPSRGFVRALDFLDMALFDAGHPGQAHGILQHAADVASQAGDRPERLRILGRLAAHDIDDASVDQIESLRAQLTETDPPELHADLAVLHTYILGILGRHAEVRQIGLPAIARAEEHGVVSSHIGAAILENVAESLLELGEVQEAAAFIDPSTDREIGSVRGPTLYLHAVRAQLDMLRGATAAASDRWADIRTAPRPSLHDANLVPWEVELHLWQGDYETALDRARSMLQRLADAEGGNAINEFLLFGCGLLVLGQRAVADLAEQGRAQHNEQAIALSRDAAADLEALRQRIQPRPFDANDPRPEAPAEMWQWRAELSRAENNSDAALWGRAAEIWEQLDRPHRAAYARWRQAEALLTAPDGRSAAATVLRRAAEQAVQHVLLATAIEDLARRARIDLAAPRPSPNKSADVQCAQTNLTDREVAVLRLLADGKTNAEIGAALFMSTKTASVHITHILRKLGVSTRVQAATVAERAGLLTSADRSDETRVQA